MIHAGRVIRTACRRDVMRPMMTPDTTLVGVREAVHMGFTEAEAEQIVQGIALSQAGDLHIRLMREGHRLRENSEQIVTEWWREQLRPRQHKILSYALG